MPDIHALDMRLAEIGRVIGHLEEVGEPIPDALLIESAEIDMAIDAIVANDRRRLPMAA